jgi:hypothetical protein
VIHQEIFFASIIAIQMALAGEFIWERGEQLR